MQCLFKEVDTPQVFLSKIFNPTPILDGVHVMSTFLSNAPTSRDLILKLSETRLEKANEKREP